MSFLVLVMTWGWIPINIILFRKFTPQKAILISVIGGLLFLPVIKLDIPMIYYGKNTAIAVSLLSGIGFSGKIRDMAFSPGWLDIPIIIWCIMSPFLSVLANDLGTYNAVAAVVQTSLDYGVFYMAGRIFFSDKEALRLLCRGIIIGGLIYVPLVLFEVRMSPQLSRIIYGFTPTSFAELIRYGGFRPIVFMDHGLMVALWMTTAYIVSFWLLSTREITEIKKIPMIVIVILLLISTILCKCSAAIVYLIFGTLGYYLKSKRIFNILIIIIPVYILLRISGILPADTIIDYLSKIFNAERIESLSTRLQQEELFGIKALERPLLGWGWIERAWPINPLTGQNAISMIDSVYLAVFSVRGYLGLLSLYSVLLLGPWKVMKSRTASIDAAVISLVLILFIIDTLLNGMINPVFILSSGALISFSEKLKYDKVTEAADL
ncbi:MAG: hypothetical protein V1874_02730 [Spirochaetota bacterium]